MRVATPEPPAAEPGALHRIRGARRVLAIEETILIMAGSGGPAWLGWRGFPVVIVMITCILIEALTDRRRDARPEWPVAVFMAARPIEAGGHFCCRKTQLVYSRPSSGES